MNSPNPLRKDLVEAAKIKESAERSVTIASVVAEALRAIGQDPILVGGAAVEFYTQGGYTTEDIDMIAPGGAELARIMMNLGFTRFGKDFVDEKNKIYIEFPGGSLGDLEQAVRIQIGKRYLRIISLEDLIVDRLCSYKFWKSAVDGLNAMKLLESGSIDEERLRARTADEGVFDALTGIREIQEEVIRKKFPPEEANRLLDSKMRQLKK